MCVPSAMLLSAPKVCSLQVRTFIFSRPAASEVLTAYLTQCNEPPWTSYFVKYSSVKDDQFGMSNFNWKVGNSNYQILRTGCFPYIKYHCSKRHEEDLNASDKFMRVIKIANLGIPCLLYGLAATQLIRHKEVVHTSKGPVTIYFLLPEHKGSRSQFEKRGGIEQTARMISAVVAAILIPLIIVYCYKNAYKRPENFPPGPPSLPVYGAYWIIRAAEYSNLSKAFVKIGQRYKTKLVGCCLAGINVVVVNDSKMIKEFLNAEVFDGRMDIILFRLRSFWKKLGIFFTDGYFWHVQRRFSLRFMRDYGFGRRDGALEDVVAHEVRTMIDMALHGPQHPAEKALVKGNLVQMPQFFAAPFINGICHVTARLTLPRSEYHTIWDLARGALLFQRSSDDLGGALSLTPWLKDVLPNWSGYNGLVKGNQALLDFFEPLINEAIATFDESHDRHFLDVYIRKMKEEQRQKKKTTYSVQQLQLICTDYMFPAASATEATLAILAERMLLQPELQARVHEEIDRVVGRDRLPTLDDRRRLPFTEACLREAMRYDTLVPLGVAHRAMENTKLGGYDIPEDTMVSPNLVVLHMDKEIWGDPETFRPERFLDENGDLCVAKDKSLPFGAGRRLCAGETFARQTMFQVFSGLMQTFHLSTADGRPLVKPAPRLQGIITTIPEFWVRLTPRQ